MSTVPTIQFPVPFERIPDEVAKLTEFIRGVEEQAEVARTMLEMVRRGCKHKYAVRGSNERDGDWMNPCPHCGASK